MNTHVVDFERGMEDEERGSEACSLTKVLAVSMRAATGELIGPGLGCTRVG